MKQWLRVGLVIARFQVRCSFAADFVRLLQSKKKKTEICYWLLLYSKFL